MFTVLYYVLQAFKNNLIIFFRSKVHLENVWTSKQMITEGDAAISLETTRRAFRNQQQSKQRSTIIIHI